MTVATKRHHWPRHENPGECRAHDQCLDCGAWLNDAKQGGIPCEPPPPSLPPVFLPADRLLCACGKPGRPYGGTVRCPGCLELVRAQRRPA
jgi:hypothetical protein